MLFSHAATRIENMIGSATWKNGLFSMLFAPSRQAGPILQQCDVDFERRHGLVQILHVALHHIQAAFDRCKASVNRCEAAIIQHERGNRHKHRSPATDERYNDVNIHPRYSISPPLSTSIA